MYKEINNEKELMKINGGGCTDINISGGISFIRKTIGAIRIWRRW
ncbi:hypothetical protein [Oceanivirga salmonicida]|nr:hypothetical protein [Oceanivirga salmonicida]